MNQAHPTAKMQHGAHRPGFCPPGQRKKPGLGKRIPLLVVTIDGAREELRSKPKPFYFACLLEPFDFRSGSEADISACLSDFRFTPECRRGLSAL
jgi:hypothetical protein